MKLEFVKIAKRVLLMIYDSNGKKIIDYIFTNALKEGFILKIY
jgi:hypothetical protein